MITFFEKILYFLPFIILFMVCTLFFMLSLTVFGEGTVLSQISGFLIQNIPTAILIVLIFLSKSYPKLGGTILIMIWLFFLIFFHAYQNLSIFIMIFPILIAGFLFFIQNKFSH